MFKFRSVLFSLLTMALVASFGISRVDCRN